MAKVVFHFRKDFHSHYHNLAHLRLFGVLHEHLLAAGGVVELADRPSAMLYPGRWRDMSIFEDGNLHIIYEGVVQHPHVLNASIAYIQPFWRLDPIGTRAFGTMHDRAYTTQEVLKPFPDRFYDNFYNGYLSGRRSRYSQAELPYDDTIPDGCLAVFLQGPFPHKSGASYCSDEELLQAVANHADGRKLVLKVHPLLKNEYVEKIAMYCLENGLRYHITDANVHDILSKCAVSISFNSGAILESYIHQKPAILFGRSDLHHIAQTVKNPDDFPSALRKALAARPNYRDYVYWYVQRNSIGIFGDRFFPEALKVFETAGFDVNRLGLKLGDEI